MKKIGEIKGVPVVEGNINEVTKNQIHYKEDSGNIQLSKRGNDNKLNSVTGSSSSGGDSKHRIEYYKIENINHILMLAELNVNVVYNAGVSLGNTVTTVVLAALDDKPEYIKSNIISINFPQYIFGEEYNSIEELINSDSVGPVGAEVIKTLLSTPATEEEFLYDFYNK